jgi:hypothetical protein
MCRLLNVNEQFLPHHCPQLQYRLASSNSFQNIPSQSLVRQFMSTATKKLDTTQPARWTFSVVNMVKYDRCTFFVRIASPFNLWSHLTLRVQSWVSTLFYFGSENWLAINWSLFLFRSSRGKNGHRWRGFPTSQNGSHWGRSIPKSDQDSPGDGIRSWIATCLVYLKVVKLEILDGRKSSGIEPVKWSGTWISTTCEKME